MMGGMEPAATVEFTRAARGLCAASRRLGLVAPSFRSPPRIVGSARTIRRRDNGAVVAVRLRGRPMAAVLSDMIEGVVVTNSLGSPAADHARTELWRATGRSDDTTGTPVAGAA